MSAQSEQENDDYIGFDCPSDLKRQVRIEAAKEDISMSQKARELLSDALED
ncbi:hypothetical protein [Halobacterium litoreum]|uniref:Ribbon-helix-helix protein, copG family n=1 Tax=Halobacterium litoreum TaxID=2039234 RepID=A0ABD5N7U9_9EURY|nr:hypothetical protein [Halobacterium litoreum]UHH14876.1 hypothetical protein LT972_14815 [Halobacterium litoreum]